LIEAFKILNDGYRYTIDLETFLKYDNGDRWKLLRSCSTSKDE